MRAIIQENYGEAENVLRLGQVGRPAIGDRAVLLCVHAAGVDRGVWHLVAVLPYAVRLAGCRSAAANLPSTVRARPEDLISLTGLLPIWLAEGALPTGVTVSWCGQIRCDLHGLHCRRGGTPSGGSYAMAGGQRSG
jgi:hypothetical protein